MKKFPATIEWFKVCDRTKPIFSYKEEEDGNTERSFYTRREKVLLLAGLYTEESKGEEASQFSDFGRHSCGTYLLAGDYSAKDASRRLGNSVPVLRDHYEDGNATEEEAKESFSIMPMNSDEKLVKFAG